MPRPYIPHPRKVRQAIIPVGPSIAYIPLTRGMFALVDRDDAELLSQSNWTAHWASNTKSFYAARGQVLKDPRETAMHRLILGLGEGEVGDHKFHNTLDNRRSQLRKVEVVHNNINQRKRSDNTSGYKGVSFERGRWKAQIQVAKKKMHIGTYDTPEEAALAYSEAALKNFGEYTTTTVSRLLPAA